MRFDALLSSFGVLFIYLFKFVACSHVTFMRQFRTKEKEKKIFMIYLEDISRREDDGRERLANYRCRRELRGCKYTTLFHESFIFL